MIVNNPKFEVSAVKPAQYPKNNLPEIVLVGKSNVGKSSFINTMINRKKLARTSSEPGKTRQINFYNIDEKFYFVDLPGYGYSKMSKKEQEQVGKFIEQYLFNRERISLIIFLVDIRHSPTENDKLMYDYVIRSGLPCIILANKADKIAVTKVSDVANKLQKTLNPIGDILSVGAAMVWSFYAVLSKKMGAFGYSVIQTTRRTFFYGILFMIPALYFFDFKWDLYRFSTPAYIFNIFYLGLGASAICFVTWNLAVRILGAIKTSVYIYLAPVVTAVASVIVLHEKITFLSGLGIVLVLGGLLLSEQKKKLFPIRGRKHTENVVE